MSIARSMMPAVARAVRLPVLRAMMLQLAALIPTALALLAAPYFSGVSLPSFLAAFLQGAFAALLSHRRLPPWWLGIQLLFPPALIAAQSFHAPPAVFLAIFLVMLGVYWTTFRTQVPYYPSGRGVRDVVSGLLPDRPHAFIDIGSGLGGLPLDLARRRKDSRYEGIEIAPVPWLISSLRVWCVHGRSACRFLRGDYHRLDFAEYDVVFAYLSPVAMPALWEKAKREMRAGTLLLSYEFVVPGIEASACIEMEGGKRMLYGWRM